MEQTGGGGTKINELMENITNNQLNDKENTMVDSIINELNNDQPNSQQQKMPQISPEEREMLMKQQMMVNFLGFVL